jgi:PLD-like domain
MNNAILIRSVPIARTYLEQWHRLHDDELVAPDGKVKHFQPPLMTSNDQPKTSGQGASGKWTAWFTRTSNRQDIAAATAVINGAQEAILFLMFEPGSNGLRQVVEARMSPGAPTFKASLYIHGVVNTLHPGGGKVDVTTVAHGDTTTIDLRVIEPQGVATNLAEWAKEVTRQDFILGQGGVIGHAIIHSKIIVVDPFTKPVVITGSHNFSSPASEANDENLLIIRDSAALAERYAVNIMSTYQHYRWRAYLRDCMVKNKPPFSALRDDDNWQKKLPEHNPELMFWLQK